MGNIIQHLTVATFLHDIGKIMQRAEVDTTEQTESMMSSAGPSRDGHSTHYHVKWTNQFFEEFFNNTGIEDSTEFNDKIAELAFRHHNPSTPLQEIVTQADRLSSGKDRGETKYQQGIHKKKRLIPLRYLLNTDGTTPKEPYPKLPLHEHTSKDDSTYPSFHLTENEILVPQYQKLWKSFLDGWQTRSALGFEATLAKIDTLFERHFSSIPASTIDIIPDNSIYEHSRSASAIAAAIYKYHESNGSLTSSDINDAKTNKFLLVSGDLSGIQNYIFAITHSSGKVAKRLRARSFILGMLSSIVARKILDQVGLPFVNLILNAGGKFHLLLDNTDFTKKILSDAEVETQKWLQEKFQGLLSINLAMVEMNGSDFSNKRLGSKFGELNQELIKKKFQPSISLLQDDQGWNEDAFLLPDAIITKESDTGEYDIEGLQNEETLGQKLPNSQCLALYNNSHDGDFELLNWSFSVAKEASSFYKEPFCVISFEKGSEDSLEFPHVPVHYEYRTAQVPRYTEEDFEKYQDEEQQVEVGLPMTFNHIATNSTGRKALGFLKADLDNLGYILQKGLDWNDIGWTFSKMATFSRSLEFFFSGRVRAILQDENYKDKGFDKIYTVFSGGDDLLLVGPWNVVHDFAIVLQKEWQKFTANNPHLTISVGIEVTNPMTPIWVAADRAEDALHKAKTMITKKQTAPKNQFCSFGHLIRWDDFDSIYSDIEQLINWLNDSETNVSVSFARNLLYFSSLAELYHQGHIEGLRYLPMLSYTINRNYNKDEHQDLRNWVEKFKDADGDPIHHLKFIAHYALNLNRGS